MKVGILGGGQLGRMLLQAAANYPVETFILENDANCPSAHLCHHFVPGNIRDFETVYQFGKNLDAVTIEIEAVNVDALEKLESEGVKVFPNSSAIKIIKNKILQKQFYSSHNIPSSQFVVTENLNELKEQGAFLPAVHKIAMAGAIGPKRLEGDYQVPEGFYYINEFNPKSTYHLSLGINYPNASDRVLSDSVKPGGDIYIHGNCVTIGCIPLQNDQIEELYILAAMAKSQGQDFIPVHIFPIRYNNRRSFEYLAKTTKDNQDLQRFAIKIKEVYDYFEEKKKLPLIFVNKKGDYVVNTNM